jgi:hypothetical protein
MEGPEHTEHGLIAEPVGHVHAVNPGVTVQSDLVRCAACDGPPAIGIAVVWQHDDADQEIGSALLDPSAALSLANSLLAGAPDGGRVRGLCCPYFKVRYRVRPATMTPSTVQIV